MTEESFIREVNEELRQERARAIWGRYGSFVLAAAVLLVIATAIYQFYTYWHEEKASQMSGAFIEAVAKANKGQTDEAEAELLKLEAKKFGVYPSLAQFERAALRINEQKFDEAVTIFDNLAADTATPEIFQKLAKIRAAYILVDHGTFEDVLTRVAPLDNDIEPFRLSAREALGLAAYRAGDLSKAASYFEKLTSETNVKSGVIGRAILMADLINTQKSMQ